jgi:hypothetical protein
VLEEQETVLGRPRVQVERGKLKKLQQGGLSLRQIAVRAKLSVSPVARSLNTPTKSRNKGRLKDPSESLCSRSRDMFAFRPP